MPAVRQRARGRGRPGRHRDRDRPRRRRRRRRPDRGQARDHHRRLGHHHAGQRPARAAPPRRAGRRCSQPGYPFNSLGLRAPDPAGTLLAELPDARTGGADLPATLGLPRPALARILVGPRGRGRRQAPARHLGQLARPGRAGVDVTFSDGSAGRYDLVVGADGIRSATRGMIGITDEPRPTGMGIFRAFGPRPASVTRTDLYLRRPRVHRRVLPHRRGHAVRVHRGGRHATVPRSLLRNGCRRCAALAEALPRAMGRHQGDADRPVAGQLHAVRVARRARAVEPRPGRADRRRRARLPAHPRPGRRAGPGGRRRAHRAAAVARRAGRRAVGGVHRAPLRPGQDRRRGVLPARPVAARPRAGRPARPDGHASPRWSASPPDTPRSERRDRPAHHPPAPHRPRGARPREAA